MSIQSELNTAKAEVARLEVELAALPPAIISKTEAELKADYAAIVAFFRGVPQ
jgi:hypothetical protein